LLLKNPFYYGDFMWAGKLYHGSHLPLIEKELFDRVQAVFAHGNDTRSNSRDFTYKGLLRCGHCGSTITAEIKKDRYIYYHCTFDKGNCGGLYVREEELESQFQRIFDGFRFADMIVDWVKEGLQQSAHEQAKFHNNAIEKLNERLAKLQYRIQQIYLDKLDGEIEDVFYRQCVKEWQGEQDKLRMSIDRHMKADRNYIEQGIKLLDLTQRSTEIFHDKGAAEKRELIRFVMPDSTLEKDTIRPVFKPPFDIIWNLAQEARKVGRRGAALTEPERLLLLPRLDSNFRPGG
jgi:site-specific DNA recombinase